MYIGAHVSAAGGVSNAPANSAAIGAEVFQFFSRSPQGGRAAELTDAEVAAFKQNMKKYKQQAAYIHAPYFINLASTNNRIYYGSISALRSELERGSRLGVTAMMTHLGSARDLAGEQGSSPLGSNNKNHILRAKGARAIEVEKYTKNAAQKLKTKALTMVIAGITKILDGYTGSTRFLIEVSAGAGLVIGDTFEDVAKVLDALTRHPARPLRHPELHIRHPELAEGSRSAAADRIGVCLDTQHIFASGYDLRTAKAVADTLKKFDRAIGLDHLVCMHVNDSKVEFDSHKDRHEHIGKGQIGLEGFRALLGNPKLQHVDCLVETPDDSKTKDLRKEDIAILKSLRKEK